MDRVRLAHGPSAGDVLFIGLPLVAVRLVAVGILLDAVRVINIAWVGGQFCADLCNTGDGRLTSRFGVETRSTAVHPVEESDTDFVNLHLDRHVDPSRLGCIRAGVVAAVGRVGRIRRVCFVDVGVRGVGCGNWVGILVVVTDGYSHHTTVCLLPPIGDRRVRRVEEVIGSIFIADGHTVGRQGVRGIRCRRVKELVGESVDDVYCEVARYRIILAVIRRYIHIRCRLTLSRQQRDEFGRQMSRVRN